MRIPTSVIVMSVVTAVPFGLGIRETLNKKDVPADALGGLDFGGQRSARERQRALDEYEAEMRREAAEREAREKAKLEKLDQLVGAKPAQMGALLDGIVLGANAGSFQPENVRQRIENASRDGLIYVSFDADGKALNGVEVHVTSDYESADACEKLDSKLTAAWGAATNGAWLDPATHHRATLQHEDCTLRFDTYVEPAQWVAQLPINAIGTSADKLATQLGGAAEYAGDDLVWRVPGIGYGKDAATIRTRAENGKITGFRVDVFADFDSMLAVRDALSATLKAQPQKQDGDDSSFQTYEWKRKVPVVLETDTNKLTVVVGKMSWD